MAPRLFISAGSPEPLGVTLLDTGANVAVVSRNADRIVFCLFDDSDAEIARLPLPSREGDVHCGFIEGLMPGMRYGLRADGPYTPEAGHLFDPAKLLVDPYAVALDRPFAYTAALCAPPSAAIDTARLVPKAIVTAPLIDAAPRAEPAAPGFIYEVAVKAFSTANPAIPENLRGTVAAIADPASIDHLTKLGVDTVELMPLAAWIDERHLEQLGLANAWGYNPVTFMAPEPRLAPGGFAEIRNTVSALHAAGIRVVIDAVYNHTGESDLFGPTLSLRGLDNALYYRAAPDDPRTLVNDTGTGNTLAIDRPAVLRLVLDSMRTWAMATGIDGFRLDLAAILGRTESGFHRESPFFAGVEADPVLKNLVMIAEPWDIGPGGYQLGKFPHRWHEWNDRYRDDVRRFWRGDPGTLGALATRFAGSADIFAGRRPSASINFVAAHDGFSLADLVAFETKHNEANGEHNRDGTDANFSWNNGVEGPSTDTGTLARRRNDLRALLATLLLSRGTPMLTAGDEFGRSQGGNNNAYAQDNAITWLDWDVADRDLAAFVGRLAALRRAHPSLGDDSFLTGALVASADGDPRRSPLADVAWLAPHHGEMTPHHWDHGRRAVGISLFANGDRTAVWINGETELVPGWLPEPRPGMVWEQVLSSARPGPPSIPASPVFDVPPRAVVVFAEAPPAPGGE